ncbi:MAG: hypothetical protein WDN06_16925 [Asticcacaulis sp.]
MLALFVLEQDVERMLWDAHIQPGAGKIGIHAQPVRFFGEGVVEVTAVDLDSPAVRAGLREGDHLRFDRVYDFDRRMMQLGEAVGLTRLDGIAPQHMVLVAAAPGPLSAEVVFSRELFSLSTIIPALFGAFILWRSRGRPSAQWLGLALVTFGWTSPDVAMLEARPGIYAFLTAFNYAGYGAVPVAFVVFAMRAYEENVGRWRKRTWAALAGYATLAFAAAGLQAWGEITACHLAGPGRRRKPGHGRYLGRAAGRPCRPGRRPQAQQPRKPRALCPSGGSDVGAHCRPGHPVGRRLAYPGQRLVPERLHLSGRYPVGPDRAVPVRLRHFEAAGSRPWLRR